MSDPTFFPQTPLPDWAEDDSYPAGSDPWSGGPNKIEPIGAERDPGIQPDDQLGAQQYNWLNHRYGRLLRVFAHQPLMNWEARAVFNEDPAAFGAGGYAIGLSVETGTMTFPLALRAGAGSSPLDFVPQQPALMALDIGPTDGPSTMTLSVSADGKHWSDRSSGLAGDQGDPDCLADAISPAGATGNVALFSKTNTHIVVRSTDFFGTFSTITASVPNPGDTPLEHFHVFHQAKNGRLFGGVQSTTLPGFDSRRMSYSDDQGATWTAVDTGSDAYNIVSIADDGGGALDAIIVATVNRDPVSSDPVVIRSTDNGLTWSQVLVMSTAPSPTNSHVGYVDYSPVWGQFMIVRPGNGQVLISEDGGSWIARDGLPTVAGGEMLDYPSQECVHVLKCIGSVFAFIANMSGGGVFDQYPGVFYTLDLGTTWHFAGFGALEATGQKKRLINLRTWGGRFLACSRGVVYYSGMVWCPGEDVQVT